MADHGIKRYNRPISSSSKNLCPIKLGMNTEEKYIFSNTAPTDIYTISEGMGIGGDLMAKHIAQFLETALRRQY